MGPLTSRGSGVWMWRWFRGLGFRACGVRWILKVLHSLGYLIPWKFIVQQYIKVWQGFVVATCGIILAVSTCAFVFVVVAGYSHCRTS